MWLITLLHFIWHDVNTASDHVTPLVQSADVSEQKTLDSGWASRVDLWSQQTTIKNNNNIKQIRNKKLITEIWTKTITFLLLQLKYHFLKSGQTRLCHNKKIINIILIIIILQNQNQQCNKKVFNPSLSRRERERETARGWDWRRGKREKR